MDDAPNPAKPTIRITPRTLFRCRLLARDHDRERVRLVEAMQATTSDEWNPHGRTPVFARVTVFAR